MNGNLHEQLTRALSWSMDDPRLDQLLRLLSEWQSSNPTEDEARSQLEQNPTLAPMRSLISFEGATVSSGITIGDMAGGNLVKLNFVQTDGGDFAAGNIDKRQGIFITIERPSIGIPFQVPPLPSYFVARPDITTPLKAQLHNQSTTSTTSRLSILAIHGMGGSGKSTLATALARDPDVLALFPDGVLWATLGQQPNLLSLLSSWVQELGDYQLHITSSDVATNRLRSLLQSKAVLLVIDDTWDTAHVRPFLVAGSRCRIIITTRDALIAKDAGAIGKALHDVNVMTPEQALALLSKRLERPLESMEVAQARQLAETIGYLPLALELAAAQIADGVSWSELLVDLQAEIARLETLELPGTDELTDEASQKKLSLQGSLNLSLRRLSKEKIRNFAWLGVLPEDVVLTPAMAATLWETDRKIGRDILRYFRDKALLLPGIALPDGSQTYRLHDALHDLSRKLLAAPQVSTQGNQLAGLGLKLPAAHSTLLERYRKRTQGELWSTLPDDGYIHTHLAWHLEQANRHNELHTLLRETTAEGYNGWYQARERLGQIEGYLEDVLRAWRLVDKIDDEQQRSEALGLQCRYTLIISSLKSRAQGIPPILLGAAVKHGIWTIEQAKLYARQVPDKIQHFEAMLELLPLVNRSEQAEHFHEAASIVESIDHKYIQNKAFVNLLMNYPNPKPEGIWRTLLEVIPSLEDEQRNQVLSNIVSHLPETMLVYAFAIIEQIKKPTRILVEIALRLPEQQQQSAFEKILAIAKETKYLSEQVTAFLALKKHWASPEINSLRQDILALARANLSKSDIWLQLESQSALLSLLSNLEKEEQKRVLQELFAVGQRLLHDISMVAVSKRNFSEIDVHLESWYIMDLLPYFSKSEKEQTFQNLLNIYQGIVSKGYTLHRSTLTRLASELSPNKKEEVLLIIQQIKQRVSRLDALAILVPYLEGETQEAAMREVIEEARNTDDGTWLAEQVGNHASYMSSALVQTTLDATKYISKGWWTVHTLTSLAVCQREQERQTLLVEALDTARSLRGENLKKALIPLVPFLSTPLLEEALIITRAIDDGDSFVKNLLQLFTRLPSQEQVQVWRLALKVTSRPDMQFQREMLLVNLAPQLPVHLQSEALIIARSLEDKIMRVEALLELAKSFPESEREAILEEASILIESIKYAEDKAHCLVSLISVLSSSQRKKVVRQALTEIDKIDSRKLQATRIKRLAPLLTPSVRTQALEQVIQKAYPHHRVEIIEYLSPELPKKLVLEILSELQNVQEINYQLQGRNSPQALGKKSSFHRTRINLGILTTEDEDVKKLYLALGLRLAILGASTKAYKIVLEQENDSRQDEGLAGLAPYLSKPLVQKSLNRVELHYFNSEVSAKLCIRLAELGDEKVALYLARKIIESNWRARSLIEVALYLEGEERDQVLREALAVIQIIQDIDVRCELIAKLSLISTWPTMSLYVIWQEMIFHLADYTRQYLFPNLFCLAPLIARVGGTEALVKIFYAIADVCQWWP